MCVCLPPGRKIPGVEKALKALRARSCTRDSQARPAVRDTGSRFHGSMPLRTRKREIDNFRVRVGLPTVYGRILCKMSNGWCYGCYVRYGSES